MNAERIVETLLKKAGIQLNGAAPWDPQIHDPRTYWRFLLYGTMGAGESYMDGWWDAPALDEFFARILTPRVDKRFFTPALLYQKALALVSNRQSRARASQVAEGHYDLGNDLYEVMLDKRMIYTCAYWSATLKPKNLDEAQEAKLDLICRKIRLKKGDRVLDIGCGWGGFAQYAAEHYGASVVGITISKEQLALAQERCKGLPIELRFQDYRDVNETFDHIVSIEMFEAVGYKNFRTYFECAARCLKDDGLFLLQTIGDNYSRIVGEPWIEKYIFPNGALPSLAQIGKAVEGLFVVEDLHNFGADYDRTLMAWFANFDAAWPTLREKYGERFYRMWKYYLHCFAGSFRTRTISDWQIVFSKKGVPGGYTAVR